MCLAVLGECEPQRFFGAGLADRAGHADHLGFCARTRRSGESAQGGEHVRHDQKRRAARHGGAAIGGDDGESRFGRERRGDEFMPVAAIGNGEKRLAATDGAAVNRDSGHGLRQRAVAPHVSEYPEGKANACKNALNDEERADSRRSISQRKRKLIERVFGWAKRDRPLRQIKLRGLRRVDWFYRLVVTAYNLVRMRKLIPVQVG